MKNQITQAIIGGLAGTAAMTLIMFISPFMGMPKMNPAEVLSGMMHVPSFIGWTMHFMIGIIFALLYAFLLLPLLKKIRSLTLKGITFGFVAFIFAQLAMAVMGVMFGKMPAPEGNMALIAIGSIVGHLVFGIVTVLFAFDKDCACSHHSIMEY